MNLIIYEQPSVYSLITQILGTCWQCWLVVVFPACLLHLTAPFPLSLTSVTRQWSTYCCGFVVSSQGITVTSSDNSAPIQS